MYRADGQVRGGEFLGSITSCIGYLIDTEPCTPTQCRKQVSR